MAERHRWKGKPNQKQTLFLTKQCWSPRYKVSVLSTCGRWNPKEFIVASFCNLKLIGKVTVIITITINLVEASISTCIIFIFKCQFPCINFRFSLNAFFELLPGQPWVTIWVQNPKTKTKSRKPKLKMILSYFQKWKPCSYKSI